MLLPGTQMYYILFEFSNHKSIARNMNYFLYDYAMTITANYITEINVG